MLASLGSRLSVFFRATAPDPFVLAVLLTVLTFVLALTLTDTKATGLVDSWAGSEGLWKFLGFSMQMCLILVTGHALASSPPVARLLAKLASLPKSAPQASALVALVAASLGVLNWGLGLVGGALIARDVGRSLEKRGIPAHYPLLAASGYVGLLIWHGGFSGTAPLKVSTEEEIADILSGVTLEPVGLDQTILSPLNFIVTGGLILIAPIVMSLLTPKRAEDMSPASAHTRVDEPKPTSRDESKPALPRLLEDTPIVSLLLVALIAFWAWRYYLPAEGRSGVYSLTPNTVNLTMLMLGLILHGTPMRYVRAVESAARGCAGIILQFPLYAGIMGMMHASGLTAMIATSLSQNASETTLPLFTFASAGVVNFFVPSGGGQWGVQGPIAIQSALDAGVPIPKIVMSVAYGDQLTNMLQPFWALPLLAITGVKARDIVGYTALLMVIAALWIVACLLVL
jgi:short-chain fatty acids transporter